MAQLVYNRFRLKQPLRRLTGEKGTVDSKFEPITWEKALETIAAKFLALRDVSDLQKRWPSLLGWRFTPTHVGTSA